MATNFQAKKSKILEQINVPEEQYSDLSPKGSIDEGIWDLVCEINKIDGLISTSSCAGRISVFLEGQKKLSPQVQQDFSEEVLGNLYAPKAQAMAGPGGKGGGSWLFVSHDPIPKTSHANAMPDFHNLFGMNSSVPSKSSIEPEARIIHFKFEAMILHLLCASLADAQAVLSAASSAGFRESGAMGLSSSTNGIITPMVAVRSTGIGFDSIIGYQKSDGSINSLVTEEYLDLLVETANERFKVNTERIERFRAALMSSYSSSRSEVGEGKDARRARMRAEGLAKQQERMEMRKGSDAIGSPKSGSDKVTTLT